MPLLEHGGEEGLPKRGSARDGSATRAPTLDPLRPDDARVGTAGDSLEIASSARCWEALAPHRDEVAGLAPRDPPQEVAEAKGLAFEDLRALGQVGGGVLGGKEHIVLPPDALAQ